MSKHKLFNIIKQCFNKDDDDHVHNCYPIFFGMYGDRWKNIWGNRVKSRCLKQSKPKVPKIRDWRKYQDTFLFTENSNECIDFHGIPHPLDQDFQFRNNCGKGRCFKKGQKVFIELNGCVKKCFCRYYAYAYISKVLLWWLRCGVALNKTCGINVIKERAEETFPRCCPSYCNKPDEKGTGWVNNIA